MAMTALSKSSWSRHLEHLNLKGNALGEEGVEALGLGQWETSTTCSLERCGLASHAAVTCLALVHLPCLVGVVLNGNQFEAGAMGCLSAALWPKTRYVSLSSRDVDDQDWSILGICKELFCEPHANGECSIHLKIKSNNAVLPNVTFNIKLF